LLKEPNNIKKLLRRMAYLLNEGLYEKKLLFFWRYSCILLFINYLLTNKQQQIEKAKQHQQNVNIKQLLQSQSGVGV